MGHYNLKRRRDEDELLSTSRSATDGDFSGD